MSESVAIRVRGVHRSFDRFSLHVQDFRLERGYVHGLVGPNGAGKSTLIKVILNFIYPDRGQVEVLGYKQPHDDITIRQHVGYVSELPAFYPDMTVGWTIRFVSRYYPTWNDTLQKHFLSKFELDPSKRVRDLSRGMKVKLALLLALSHEPELLILDEPTSGIDPIARKELLEEITEAIQDERRSVIFSSHITQDIEQIADYVAIIHEGSIVEHDEKEALLGRWKRVTGTLEAPDVELSDLFRACAIDARRFTGMTSDYSSRWHAELRARGCDHTEVMNVSVEDILLSIVGRRSKSNRDRSESGSSHG